MRGVLESELISQYNVDLITHLQEVGPNLNFMVTVY